MNFGESIKQWRKDNKVSQEALAQKLNVDRTTVIKWEKGTMPRYTKLKEVCDTLGVICDAYKMIEDVETDQFLDQETYMFDFVIDVENYLDKQNRKIIVKKDDLFIGSLSEENYDRIQKALDEYAEYLIKKYSE